MHKIKFMELEQDISDLIQNLATGFDDLKEKFTELCEKLEIQEKEKEPRQSTDIPPQPNYILKKLSNRLDHLESKLEELDKINFNNSSSGKLTEFPKWLIAKPTNEQLEEQEIQSLRFSFAKKIVNHYRDHIGGTANMMLEIHPLVSNKNIIRLGKELEKLFGPIYLHLRSPTKQIKFAEFDPLLHKCSYYYIVFYGSHYSNIRS